VFVGECVVNCVDLGNSSQNLVSHLVHGRLHTGAVVLGECLQCDISRSFPSTVEVNGLDLFQCLEELPLPARFDVCAEDAIPGLGQTCVLVAVEAVECRAGALEHQQLLDLGADGRALSLPCDCLDDANFIAVAVEGVGVRLAVDFHASPSVLDNLDVCSVDVGICVDEVIADDGGKLLRGVDGVLFGKNVGSLLLGVCCNNNRVVCLGVATQNEPWCLLELTSHLRGVDVAFEQDADGLLDNGVNTSLGVLIDLVQTNVVLAVAGVAKLRHDG
jgi:hypothetical protein